jgi:o-succinylbenzoate synthase
MGIKEIRVYSVKLQYKEPFRIALGTSTESHNVIVQVITDFEIEGWGEASPSQRITGETPQTVMEALDKISPKLIGMCPLRIEHVVEIMDETVSGNPSAKAAIDMALHDILGKVAQRPLYRVIGGYRTKVLTDFTLGIKSPQEMAEAAVKAIEQGFRALKIKVGINPEEDVERVAMVRNSVGNKVALRIDANQGWAPEQAVNVLKKLERFDLEFVEQPVKANDLEGLAYVRKNSTIPIMADEAVHSPRDALKTVEAEAVDLINIKLMKCGGILNARKIAAIAEAAAVPCMIGCMGESGLGITAAVHLAAATKNIRYADLDSDLLLKDKLIEKGCAELEGSLRIPPNQPGIGIQKIFHGKLGKPIKVYR